MRYVLYCCVLLLYACADAPRTDGYQWPNIETSKADLEEIQAALEDYKRRREPYQLTEYEVATCALNAGWRREHLERLLKHAYCESRWIENAINKTTRKHYGLLQVATYHDTRLGFADHEILLSCPENMRYALMLFEQDGWSPWTETYSCVRRGPKGARWPEILSGRYGS